jgi:hypothetical protein
MRVEDEVWRGTETLEVRRGGESGVSHISRPWAYPLTPSPSPLNEENSHIDR